MDPVRDAIYDRLASFTPLTSLLSGGADGIHFRIAPQGQSTPFVVFAKQSGTPSRSLGGGASKTENELWNIRATSRGGPGASQAEDCAAQIDAALDGYQLVVSGRATLYLRRDSDLNYGDAEDGTVWHYVGGLYRVITQ